MSKVENKFEFICVVETHIRDVEENKSIELKNYNTIRCDSESSYTGGVVLYIKDYWSCEVLQNISSAKQLWWLSVKVCLKI